MSIILAVTRIHAGSSLSSMLILLSTMLGLNYPRRFRISFTKKKQKECFAGDRGETFFQK
jgi:hypothetical protein